MPRMRILNLNEREAFDQPPVFDHLERKRFFTLPKSMMHIAETLRTPSSQIGFLLMCGYFKASRRFYQPQDFHERDIAFMARQINLQSQSFTPDDYPKSTRLRHQRMILEFYGFNPFDQVAESKLAVEIATMARIHLKPRLIFDRCVDYLIQSRILVPQSGTLIELIRNGMQERKAELVAIMDDRIGDITRGLLDDLFTTSDQTNRYRLTLLKKLPQSTRPTHIRESIADFQTLSELYKQLE